MPELSTLADSTANRLRLLQIELADANEEERKEFLTREITGVLKSVLPDKRRAFLTELEHRFPTWELRSGGAGQSEAAPGRPEAPPEEHDWTFFLNELLKAVEGLSDGERQKLIERLAAAGLAPRSEGEWPVGSAEELRSKLGIRDNQSLIPEQVVKLTVLLVELANGLERTIWKTWREIAPRSLIKKTGNLPKAMAESATGGETAHVKSQIDQLRSLIVGITNSVAFLGYKVADKYLNELSPEAIKRTVPDPGMFRREARWWEKYEQLAWGPRDTIDREVREMVHKATEEIIQGLQPLQ